VVVCRSAAAALLVGGGFGWAVSGGRRGLFGPGSRKRETPSRRPTPVMARRRDRPSSNPTGHDGPTTPADQRAATPPRRRRPQPPPTAPQRHRPRSRPPPGLLLGAIALGHASELWRLGARALSRRSKSHLVQHSNGRHGTMPGRFFVFSPSIPSCLRRRRVDVIEYRG